MPLYEYYCAKCDKVFEKLQKYSDPPLIQCDECGGKVDKQVSRSAFHLKGTGWYATDYKKSGAPPKKEAEKPADQKDAKKVEETKPVVGTETNKKSDSKTGPDKKT